MQITGGKVSFRRVVQPAQYESKEGLVELSFAVAEGEGDKAQAFLDATAQMAQAKALELVGLKPATTAAKPDLKVVETQPSQADKDAQKAKAAAKLNAKEKKEPAKPSASELDGLEDKPQISKNPEDRKDPAAADLDGLDTDVVGDPDLDPPKEVTDADLRDAVQAHVAKHKNNAAVKELRQKFTGDPAKFLPDIPQEKRAAFLAELAKLVPKAA